MTEGIIQNWLKSEGDAVTAGEPILELVTDKSTIDFEWTDDGYLAKILVQSAEDTGKEVKLPVGAVLGVICEEEDDIAAFKDYTDDTAAVEEAAPAAAEKVQEEKPEETKEVKQEAGVETKKQDGAKPASGDRVFMSPLAKKTLIEAGINLEGLKPGSGPKGRLVFKDAIDLISEKKSSMPSSTSTQTHTEESRQETVSDLVSLIVKSKREVPHFYLNVDVDLTKAERLLGSGLAGEQEISLISLVMMAASKSMKTVPAVNSSYVESDGVIRTFKNCDVNIFSEEGGIHLIRDANVKGLLELSAEYKDLVSGEGSGESGLGSFSVMHLEGVKGVNPAVIYGQAATLGVGEMEKVVVSDTDKDGALSFKEISTVSVSLSCDHRVVDGAVGAQWLQRFKSLMENPDFLLL